MNSELTQSCILKAIYELKEGSKSSYYWKSGTTILPNRLSISHDSEMTKVQRKGRNLLEPTLGQLIGRFKQSENSSMKQFKPYNLRTQIWRKTAFPNLTGYGTIGISSYPDGNIRDTQDLLVVCADKEWKTIQVYIALGRGNVNSIEETLQYLDESIYNN